MGKAARDGFIGIGSCWADSQYSDYNSGRGGFAPLCDQFFNDLASFDEGAFGEYTEKGTLWEKFYSDDVTGGFKDTTSKIGEPIRFGQ